MNISEEKKEELLKLCGEYEDFHGYTLNRGLFNEFYETGNRIRYENDYFSRRRCLAARAVRAIISDDGIGDAKLLEIINAVCDEFTWALPAHVERDAENPAAVIDLFSAETAQTLAELSHYTELPQKTRARIHSLIFERIIKPYESGTFRWEESTHNWAAVCGGCVGMVYIYEFPERFETVKERVLATMSCFLSGYGDDGACLEGLGYWGYGFGYFVYFAELLRRFDGTDLLAGKKIERISRFQQYMFLKNGVCASFSDAPRDGGFNIGLACFLNGKFGSKIPDVAYRADLDECGRFAPYLRSFLWLDEGLIESSKAEYGEKYFADAQWYIAKHEKFAFAAKGGNNGEPHNHNDVGGFIIADGAEQLITDFGAGEYTRDYFGERRYDYVYASSSGHSVPIIDGGYQKDGAKYRAEILKAGNGVFALDISGAYGLDKPGKIVREFKISKDKILLRDELALFGKSAVERLVSLQKPGTENGDTKIKNMTIRSEVVPKINAVTLKNHAGADETIYILDYAIASDKFECEFIFA